MMLQHCSVCTGFIRSDLASQLLCLECTWSHEQDAADLSMPCLLAGEQGTKSQSETCAVVGIGKHSVDSGPRS